MGVSMRIAGENESDRLVWVKVYSLLGARHASIRPGRLWTLDSTTEHFAKRGVFIMVEMFNLAACPRGRRIAFSYKSLGVRE